MSAGRRFQNFSTYERDGLHISIDRNWGTAGVAIRIYREGYYGGDLGTALVNGQWTTVEDGAVIPPAIILPHDILLALQAALNEDEVPTASTNTLLANTLKTEQTRVDKLLDHILKGTAE